MASFASSATTGGARKLPGPKQWSASLPSATSRKNAWKSVFFCKKYKYAREKGLVQDPRPNTGRAEKMRVYQFFFVKKNNLKTMWKRWRTQAAWTKTMVSFASVRHHGWRTQAAWTNCWFHSFMGLLRTVLITSQHSPNQTKSCLSVCRVRHGTDWTAALELNNSFSIFIFKMEFMGIRFNCDLCDYSSTQKEAN